MKAFALAVVIAAVVATGVGFTFNSLNETSAQAYSTSGARLDYLEAVTDYGRQPVHVEGLPRS